VDTYNVTGVAIVDVQAKDEVDAMRTASQRYNTKNMRLYVMDVKRRGEETETARASEALGRSGSQEPG